MRRILVLISIVFACNSVFAQAGTSKSTNFNALEKKIAKSNADIENPKKVIKDATWISRAELMTDVYNAHILNAYLDMTLDNFNLIVGKPNEQTNIDVDGVSTDKFVMDRVDFFFVEGKLNYWVVTKPLIENPLEVSLACLNKAIEIDASGKKTKKITENLATLKRLFVDEGLNCYKGKNYAAACKNFKNSIEISLMPQVKSLDTAIFYYAALSAQLAGSYAEAVELYNKSLEYNYSEEGVAYYNIYDAYKQMGKEDEGIKYLEVGLVKFPQNLNILFSLINCYINKGEDPTKIIVYIDKALADSPNNESLLFAKGTLYDKLEQFDNAIEAYKKAIEINPNYFDAYYNAGAVYYNMGVKIVEESSKIPASKVKEYEALIEKSNAEFKKAIPFMVKAAEVNPQSKDAIEAVVNLYFRFRNESQEMMDLHNVYKAKLDELNK